MRYTSPRSHLAIATIDGGAWAGLGMGATGRCGAVALSPPSPAPPRHRPRTGVLSYIALLTLLLTLLTLVTPLLTAQSPRPSQTTTVTTILRTDTIPDSLRHPPISTRRAFLTSLLIPGYAQARLNRPVAAMIFASAEILSIGMARKAAQDLREARDAIRDSTRTLTIDPSTGVTDTLYNSTRFSDALIHARRVHYEDWFAALAFNHLLASADAYVCANLWDFNANLTPTVSVNPVQRSASIGGSITF